MESYEEFVEKRKSTGIMKFFSVNKKNAKSLGESDKKVEMRSDVKIGKEEEAVKVNSSRNSQKDDDNHEEDNNGIIKG